MKSKIVYVLLDGVGDLPNPELRGLTPLQFASTPSLDSLATNGSMGEVITVGNDIAPQSDIAVFNMLGYNFKDEQYVGRGVIELMGSGISFRNGDLAMRGNLATIDGDNRILDRRAGRNISTTEANTVCKVLCSKVKFNNPHISLIIKPTVGHRVVLRFRHETLKLSNNISNTDPAYDKVSGIGVAKTSQFQDNIETSTPGEDTIEAMVSAELVNHFSKQAIDILRTEPLNRAREKVGKKAINCVLLRDAGNKIPKLDPIEMKYGLRTAAVVDMPVEIGIANLLKMDILDPGKVDDYSHKAEVIHSNLSKYQLIYAHIKGPDEYGHDGDANGKASNIEKIDRTFFAKLLEKSKYDDFTLVISADHSTPCIKRSHTADPVPLLISSRHVLNDGSHRFTEEFASKGYLGRISGNQLLSTVMQTVEGLKFRP